MTLEVHLAPSLHRGFPHLWILRPPLPPSRRGYSVQAMLLHQLTPFHIVREHYLYVLYLQQSFEFLNTCFPLLNLGELVL